MRPLLLVILLILAASEAFAADVYMSTTGTKTTGKSTIGDWSNANCYANLQAAMAAASGGDTITIDDGTYPATNNIMDSAHHPPSGSAGAFTVIRARNIPGLNGVAENQPLKVHFLGSTTFFDGGGLSSPAVQYVKFWGIRWDGIATASQWDHIYFKQVASMGTLDGNNAAFSITGQYNLLEDCVAFGKGRYKFLFYDVSRESQTRGDGYNLCRRCIVRHDWAMKEDSSGNPIAAFASYFNRKTAFLNCLDVDSNLPAYWMNGGGSNLFGSYYQAVDGGVHGMQVKGGIVVNAAYGVAYGDQPLSASVDTGNVFTDVVGVNVAGGLRLRAGNTIDRLTLANVSTAPFAYRSNQAALVLTANFGAAGYDRTTTLSNSIFTNLAGNALQQAITGDYVNRYNTAGGGITPTHMTTTNPLTTGLLYPVRVESGSALATSGSSGQLGARIVNKLGSDGTFQGDTGWATEQGPLWPWPLESWVKAELRTSDYASFCAPFAGTGQPCPSSYTTDAQRGFAADGQTLTKYIWEALGNPIPSDIYGGTVTPNTTRVFNGRFSGSWH